MKWNTPAILALLAAWEGQAFLGTNDNSRRILSTPPTGSRVGALPPSSNNNHNLHRTGIILNASSRKRSSVGDKYDRKYLLQEYTAWKQRQNKSQEAAFDPVKFEQFAKNFKALQQANALAAKDAIAKGLEPPIPRQLNHYGDWSPEDYRMAQKKGRRMMKTQMELPTTPTRTVSSRKSQQVAQGSMYFVGGDDDGDAVMPVDMDWFRKDITMDRIDKIRTVYRKFVQYFAKDFSEARLEIFGAHLRQIERRHSYNGGSSTSSFVDLNEFADWTTQEYREFGGRKEPTVAALPRLKGMATTAGAASATAKSTTTKARQVYQEWCEYYDKIPSRFEAFLENWDLVQHHHQTTGQSVHLNEWADLTPAEYQRYLKHGQLPRGYELTDTIEEDEYEEDEEYEEEDDDLLEDAFLLPSSSTPSVVADSHFMQENEDNFFDAYDDEYEKEDDDLAQPPPPRRRPSAIRVDQDSVTQNIRPLAPPSYSRRSTTSSRSPVTTPKARTRTPSSLPKKQRKTVYVDPTSSMDLISTSNLVAASSRQKPKSKVSSLEQEELERLEALEEAQHRAEEQILLLEEKQRELEEAEQRLLQEEARLEAERLAQEEERRKQKEKEEKQRAESTRRLERFAQAAREKAAQVEMGSTVSSSKLDKFRAFTEAKRLAEEAQKRQAESNERRQGSITVAAATPDGATSQERLEMELQRRAEEEAAKAEEERLRLEEEKRQEKEAEELRLQLEADEKRAKEREAKTMEDMQRRFEAERTKKQRMEEDRSRQLLEQQRQFAEAEAARLEAQHRARERDQQEIERQRILQEETRKEELARQRRAEEKLASIKEREAEQARIRAQEARLSEIAEQRKAEDKMKKIEEARRRADEIAQLEEAEMRRKQEEETRINQENAAARAEAVDRQPEQEVVINTNSMSSFFKSGFQGAEDDAENDSISSFPSTPMDDEPIISKPVSKTVLSTFDNSQSSQLPFEAVTATSNSFGSVSSEEKRNEPGPPSFNNPGSFDPNQSTTEATKPATSTNQVPSNPFASFDPTANQSTTEATKPATSTNQVPSNPFASFDPTANQAKTEATKPATSTNQVPSNPFASFDPTANQSTAPRTFKPFGTPQNIADLAGNEPSDQSLKEASKAQMKNVDSAPFSPFKAPGAARESPVSSSEPMGKGDKENTNSQPLGEPAPDSVPFGLKAVNDTGNKQDETRRDDVQAYLERTTNPFASFPVPPTLPASESKERFTAVNTQTKDTKEDETEQQDGFPILDVNQGDESKPKPFAPFPGTSATANTPASKPFAPKPFAPFNPKASDENKTEGSTEMPFAPFPKAVEKNTTAIDESIKSDTSNGNEDQEGDESKPKPFAPFPGTSATANTPASKPFAPKPFAPFNPKASDENKTEGSTEMPFAPFPKAVEKNTTAIDESIKSDTSNGNEDQEGDESKPKPFAPFPGTSATANTPASKPFAPKPFAPFNPKASDENKTEGSTAKPFAPFPKAVEKNTTAIDESIKSDTSNGNEDQEGDESKPKPFAPFPGTSATANTPASKPFAPKPFAPFNPKASDENKTEGSTEMPFAPFPKAVEKNTTAIDESIKSDTSNGNEDQEGDESKPKPFAPFPGTSGTANTPASKPFAPKPFAPFNPKASDENQTEGSTAMPFAPFPKAVEKNTTAIDESIKSDTSNGNEDQEGDESKPKPFSPFPGTSTGVNTPASKPFAPKPFAPFNPKASDENKTEGSTAMPFAPFPKAVEKNTTAIDESIKSDTSNGNEDQEGDESKPKPFAPFPGTSATANTPASKPFAPKPFAPFNPKASDENKTEGSTEMPFAPFPKAVEKNTTAIDESIKSDTSNGNEDQEGDESKPKPFAPFPGTSGTANTPASKPFAPKPFAPFNPKASDENQTEGSTAMPFAPFPKAVEKNTTAIDESIKSDTSNGNEDQEGDESKPKPFSPFPGTSTGVNTPASKPFAPKPFAPFNPKASDENKTEGSTAMPFAPFPKAVEKNTTAIDESIKSDTSNGNEDQEGDESKPKPFAPFPGTSGTANTPASKPFAPKPFAPFNPKASDENKTEGSTEMPFAPFPKAVEKNTTAIDESIKSDTSNGNEDQEGDESKPKPFAPFPGTSTGVNTPASKPFAPKPFAPFNPKGSEDKKTEGSTAMPFAPFPTAGKNNTTAIDESQEASARTIPDSTEEKFEDGDELTPNAIAPFPASSTSLNTLNSTSLATKPFATSSGENKTEGSTVKQFSPFPTAANKTAIAIDENTKSEVNAQDDDELRPKPFAPFPGTSTGVNTPASKPFVPKPFAPFNPQASGTKQTDGNTKKPFPTAVKKNLTTINGGVESNPKETTESIPGVSTNTSSSLGSQSPKTKGGKRIEQQVKLREEENERMKSIAASQASEREQLDREDMARDEVTEALTKKRKAEINLLDDMEVKQAENLRILDELDEARLKKKRVQTEAFKAASAANVQQGSEKERRALQRFQDLQKMTLEAPTSSSKSKPNPNTVSQSSNAARLAEKNELDQRESENRKKFETLRRLSLEEAESRPKPNPDTESQSSNAARLAENNELDQRESENRKKFETLRRLSLEEAESRPKPNPDTESQSSNAARLAENNELDQRESENRKKFETLRRLSLEEAESRPQVSAQETPPVSPKGSSAPSDDFERREAEKLRFLLDQEDKLKLDEKRERKVADSKLDEKRSDESRRVDNKIANAQRSFGKLQEMELKSALGKEAEAKRQEEQRKARLQKKETKRRWEEESRLRAIARRQAEEREQILLDDAKNRQRKASQAETKPDVSAVSSLDDSIVEEIEKQRVERLRELSLMDGTRRQQAKSDTLRAERERKKAEDRRAKEEAERLKMIARRQAEEREEINEEEQKKDSQTVELNQSKSMEQPGPSIEIVNAYEQDELVRQQKKEMQKLKAEGERERQKQRARKADSMKGIDIMGWVRPKKKEKDSRSEAKPSLQDEKEWTGEPAPGANSSIEQAEKSNLDQDDVKCRIKEAKPESNNKLKQLREQEEFKRQRQAEIERLREEVELERQAAMEASENDTIDSLKALETKAEDRSEAELRATELSKLTQQAEDDAKKAMEARIKLEESARAKEENLRREQAAQAAIAEKQAKEDAAMAAEMIRIQEEKFKRERAAEIARLKEEAERERTRKAQVDAEEVARVQAKEAAERRMQQERFERERAQEIARLKEEAIKERQLKAKAATSSPSNPTVFEGNPVEGKAVQARDAVPASQAKESAKEVSDKEAIQRRRQQAQFERERRAEIARLKEEAEKERQNRPAESMIEKGKRNTVNSSTDNKSNISQSLKAASAAPTAPKVQFEEERAKEIARLKEVVERERTERERKERDNTKPRITSRVPGRPSFSLSKADGTMPEKTRVKPPLTPTQSTPVPKVSTVNDNPKKVTPFPTTSKLNMTEVAQATKATSQPTKTEATDDSLLGKVSSFFGFGNSKSAKKTKTDRKAMEESKASWEEIRRKRQETSVESNRLKMEQEEWKKVQLDLQRESDEVRKSQKQQKQKPEEEKKRGGFDLFNIFGGPTVDTTEAKDSMFFLEKEDKDSPNMEDTDPLVFATKGGDEAADDLFFLDTTNGKSKPFFLNPDGSTTNTDASVKKTEAAKNKTTQPKPIGAMKQSPRPSKEVPKPAKIAPGPSKTPAKQQPTKAWYNSPNSEGKSTSSAGISRVNGAAKVNGTTKGGGINGNAQSTAPTKLPINGSRPRLNGDIPVNGKASLQNPSSPFASSKRVATFDTLKKKDDPNNKPAPSSPFNQPNKEESPFSFLSQANQEAQKSKPPPATRRSNQTLNNPFSFLQKANEAKQQQDLPPSQQPPKTTSFSGKEVVTLSRWWQASDRSLTGFINEEDTDGTSRKWTTAPLAPGIQPKKGQVVETQDGKMYRLE